MPTFTSVTLDRFLEPGETKSPKRNMPTMEMRIHLSDSSFSFPPSPHTINHKRQESPLFNNFSQGQEAVENGRSANGKDVVVTAPVLSYRDDVVKTYDKFNGFQNGKLHNISLEGTGDSSSAFVPISPDGGDVVSDDFFDPRESLSVTSSVEAEDNIGERSFKVNTPMAEFYDAYEELSEGGSQSSLRDVEAELRERRLSWLMEIEGRKQAEEALDNMKRQWERLAQKLLLEGLTLPSSSTIAAEDEKLEIDPAEELCQQIRLARAVSTSVGRGAAKAEAEMELESKIESKNFEIARLLQRLHYYETVNGEMSLRNQEATDMARRLTQKRKRRQSWIWGAVGASVVLGSMALAWSLLPSASGSPPTDSFDAPEGESATNELAN